MREDGCDRETAWALDIHEVRIWRLHKSLELVPLLFGFLGGIEKIDGERHDCEEGYRRRRNAKVFVDG